MKTILITGARSGIAHHVIRQLLNENVHLYVTVHTEEQLQAVQKKYQEEIHVTCLKLDITKHEDWKQLDDIHIDIYIANAAIGMGGSIIDMNIDRIRENYEVNVFSNLAFLQFVLQKMIERKKGKIIVMASLAGIVPIPFLGSYCSTKASLIKWISCLRLELRELHLPIQLSMIEPGLYHTGFNEVMFENKYPELESDQLFDEVLSFLHKQDQTLLLMEHQNFDSIVRKIMKAIHAKHPRFIYRAPLGQVIGAKLYQIFLE